MKIKKEKVTPMSRMIELKTKLIEKNVKEIARIRHEADVQIEKIEFRNKINKTLIEALKRGV